MGPRYSIIPSRFFDDDRPKPSHFKVMGYLGKHSDKSGWMKLSQTKAATDDKLGISRETICRAISDLVAWGYVEKRTKAETKRSICFYRILMDASEDPVDDVPEIEGGCDVALTGGCDGTGHRVVTSDITRVVTSDVTIKKVPSSKIKPNNDQRASAPSEVLKSDLGSEGPTASKALPVFTIQPGEAAWQHWIEHFRAAGKDDLAFDATELKRIKASTRWPKPESQIFEPKPRKKGANVSDVLTGEGHTA